MINPPLQTTADHWPAGGIHGGRAARDAVPHRAGDDRRAAVSPSARAR